MIPSDEERARFERTAELSMIASQVAGLIAKRALTAAEKDQVLADAKELLKTPAVETIVDRARRIARGW